MKRLLSILLMVILVTAVFAGCGSESSSESASDADMSSISLDEYGMELGEYPVVDGSVLMLQLSEAICQKLTGGTLGEIHSRVVHNGKQAAMQNLFDGYTDLIFIEGDESEITTAAAEAGVAVEVVPVARDYYTFVTQEGDPLAEKGLTVEEAKQVLLGTSSTDSWCLKGFYLAYRDPSGLAVLDVAGVHPSVEACRSGEYDSALVFNYNAVIRADTPADSKARVVIEALTSEEGQKLVGKVGYIEL